MLSLIVALDEQNGIGKNNGLLAHLPNDLKWFKKQTLYHTVVMGRKTYESLPNGALPKRRNIVMSRSISYLPDAEVVSSINEILSIIDPSDEVFIIGGAEIFRLFLPMVQKLYITRIHNIFDADTFFPEYSLTDWILVFKQFNSKDSKNKFDHTFEIYQRK